MAVDKISARERLIQRHGVYIVDDWKLAELALNSLMDELDQSDTGLSAEQAMEVALTEVQGARDETSGRYPVIPKA